MPSEPCATHRLFAVSPLLQWTTNVFIACGLQPDDAEIGAALLLRASLRGRETHGVARLPRYVEALRSGSISPRTQLRHQTRDGLDLIDTGRSFGPVALSRAVSLAIENAQGRAATLSLVNTSGHLDAIGLYALQASERSMIAVLCKNTPPLMALPGSRRPAIGNNPIAFSVPVRGNPPIVFDMATSVVSRSSLMAALDEGRRLPDGWAVDSDGEPTNDPLAGLQGALMAAAGHKGIGLAMLVQCLTKSLSEDSPYGDHREDVFLLLVNPDRVIGRALFEKHVQEWLTTYLEASADARYPGKRSADLEQTRRRTGLPLPERTVAELQRTGEIVGCPFAPLPGRSAASTSQKT